MFMSNVASVATHPRCRRNLTKDWNLVKDRLITVTHFPLQQDVTWVIIAGRSQDVGACSPVMPCERQLTQSDGGLASGW